jgi:hypothetical protein
MALQETQCVAVTAVASVCSVQVTLLDGACSSPRNSTLHARGVALVVLLQPWGIARHQVLLHVHATTSCRVPAGQCTSGAIKLDCQLKCAVAPVPGLYVLLFGTVCNTGRMRGLRILSDD